MLSFFYAAPILFPSFLAAIGASVAGGIVGSYIVVKRIVSLSGSIAHSILGGIGITLWIQYTFHLHFSPILGVILGSILTALCIGKVHLKYREREDALISMIWSVGMAIGMLFFSKLPSFNSELVNFLFGNILWVTTQDLYCLLALDLFILLTVKICHTRFLALCFDEKYMTLNQYKVQRWYYLLLVLTAITTVLLMYVMGIILMLSMLVLPISIASRFSYKLTHIMGLSVLLNAVCSICGIVLAYFLDLPVGPAIAVLMGFIYVLSLFVNRACKASVPSPVKPEIRTNS